MECEILGARVPSSLKGQSEMMEHILMVVFIVAAILALILFLTWWNVQQLNMEASRNRQDRILDLAQHMMGDYLLVNENYMLDDAKLTSVNAVSGCEKLERLFGTDWYARVRALDMEDEIPCTWNNYPDCNSWTICSYPEERRNVLVQKFPANVYRKVSDKVALAVLEVGVYS
ncbi:MAG TPA: hypothetical protein VJ485_01000 [archaeon]|jgi:Tfp pilus assembly protein PilE|nr:hypothetical protein [archaeon]